MKHGECARAWQAEAAEDGRLSEADARSFRRHAATCETCERKVRALAVLQETAVRLPILTSTPLERRRLRNETLRRANELSLPSPRASVRSGLLVAVGVIAVVAAGALWFERPRRAPNAAVGSATLVPVPVPVPTFRITASPGAEWHTVERSRTLRLSLQRGQFELTVDKLRSDQHFLLNLPDGELEVRGTRFVVQVDGARTLAVRVKEGVVALRIQGPSSRELFAGGDWQAAPPAAVLALPQASAIATPSPLPATTLTERVRGEPDQRREREREAPVATTPPADATVSSPSMGHDFSSAMSAFSAGDYGRAERLFEEFERSHPSDSRVEDATFLRAVARSRRGDSNGAATVAREYLRRYPNGLRRADVELLAH